MSFLLPGTHVFKQAFRAACMAAVFVAAPATAAQESCHLPAGRVVAHDRLADLLSVPVPGGAALFACIHRSGRKVGLDDGFTDARISGRWVAWQRPAAAGQWRIAVHDLRSGKERLVDGHVAAHSLRVTTRGTVVWAQRQRSLASTPLYANEVRTGGRLLAGGDVDARSVRLVGRRLSWFTYDGVKHAATVR